MLTMWCCWTRRVLKQGKPDDVFASPEFQKVFGLGAKTAQCPAAAWRGTLDGAQGGNAEEEIARAAAVVDDETKGGQA